jgi:hypothetical protein
MEKIYKQDLNEALVRLRKNIPRAIDRLSHKGNEDIVAWTHIVDSKLISRLAPDFPLMATICGGGSAGKSTLFNSLVGETLSPVGGSAGINRRILVSAHGDLFNTPDFLSTLFNPFGCRPEPLKNKRDLTTTGCPLYALSDAVPLNLVLMDTPDFDTGARGIYANRDAAEQALEASDILIYIFTNSNYHNRENTDFISQILTGIGMRKCFLVYRVYPSFEEQEVLDHAMTVARNLYGAEAEKYVLGIYRTDENNAVAAGKQPMELRSMRGGDASLMNALKAIDARELRIELLGSILKDVLEKAREILDHAKIAHHELVLYLDTLQTAQSRSVHEALQHFPIDQVMKRFVEIWLSADPAYIKIMRGTGRLIDLPLKFLSGTVRRIKEGLSDAKPVIPSTNDFNDRLEEDLVNAVSNMYTLAVGAEISVSASLNDPVAKRMLETVEQVRAAKGIDGIQNPHVETTGKTGTLSFRIGAHPAIFHVQKRLRAREWKSVFRSILSRRDLIVDLSQGVEKDLETLADQFRNKMGLWAKIQQTFSAFLNVLPATAAVTYVLSTGDPVGATGIKVKLTGLFGLHDLYALVAIPATTGLKKADQKQIEAMLGPIIQAWLNDKLKTVQDLFEEEITGEIIQTAQDALADSEKLIKEIEISIETCGRAMTS